MDPLTHSLTGYAVAKALDKDSIPYATLLSILAANAPDIDIVVALTHGYWDYVHHHRGITHSIIGIILLALFAPFLFWLIDALIAYFRHRPKRVDLHKLLLISFVATSTHPILDWTNNYGIRPLLPWDESWVYGDIAFILDPWLWLLLGAVLFLLSTRKRWQIFIWALLATVVLSSLIIVAVITRNIFSYFTPIIWVAVCFLLTYIYRRGISSVGRQKVAIISLCLALAYLMSLYVIHKLAVRKANKLVQVIANEENEVLYKMAVIPFFSNPIQWRCIAETNRATYRFDFPLVESSEDWKSKARMVKYEKPEGASKEVVDLALKDNRVEIFMRFARFPALAIKDQVGGKKVIQFADLRFGEPGTNQRNMALEVTVPSP
jgi:inner membrane protein